MKTPSFKLQAPWKPQQRRPNLYEVYNAFRICRSLRNEPLDVRYSGHGKWEYNPRLDLKQIAYSIARETISKRPIIEKLLYI